MSVNKAIILGNVTRDPEIKTMSNGNEVANLSIATDESWKDKDGKMNKKTEYHKCVVFSSGLVGIIKDYVKTGSKLYIEGSLQTRKWTDKDGNDKYVTEIVLQGYGCSLQLLDGRGENV
jgi:single-strand DNA-binding protein